MLAHTRSRSVSHRLIDRRVESPSPPSVEYASVVENARTDTYIVLRHGRNRQSHVQRANLFYRYISQNRIDRRSITVVCSPADTDDGDWPTGKKSDSSCRIVVNICEIYCPAQIDVRTALCLHVFVTGSCRKSPVRNLHRPITKRPNARWKTAITRTKNVHEFCQTLCFTNGDATHRFITWFYFFSTTHDRVLGPNAL